MPSPRKWRNSLTDKTKGAACSSVCALLAFLKTYSKGTGCKPRGDTALRAPSQTCPIAASNDPPRPAWRGREGTLRGLEVVQRRVNVVRQVALGLPQVLDLRSLSIETRFENGI